VKEDKVNEQVK
jgi:hypothetical protein